MKFFVLTFSNGEVVAEYFGNIRAAEGFAVNFCQKHNCTLTEMLGMQSIDDYLCEEESK